MKSDFQKLGRSSSVLKKIFSRYAISIILASGLIAPTANASIVEFQQGDFVGTFGVDYPTLNPLIDISDGDSNTADYFYEWTFSSRNLAGDFHYNRTSSIFGHAPTLLNSSNRDDFFPTVDNYILTLTMSVFHQVGGLAECGPHDGCFNSSLSFDEIFTSGSLNVSYVPSAVPAPAAVWLFGSGLLGLVGIARRKPKH